MKLALMSAALLAAAGAAHAGSGPYCTLYSREWLKEQVIELDGGKTYTPESAALMLRDAYTACLLVGEDPELPPYVESDEAFLAHVMTALHNLKGGARQQPDPQAVASSPPPPPAKAQAVAWVCGRRSPPDGDQGTAARAKWCRANYATVNKVGAVLCRDKHWSPCL